MTQYELVGKIMSLGSQNKGANPEAKMKAKNQGVMLLNQYLQSKDENLPISGVVGSAFSDKQKTSLLYTIKQIIDYTKRTILIDDSDFSDEQIVKMIEDDFFGE